MLGYCSSDAKHQPRFAANIHISGCDHVATHQAARGAHEPLDLSNDLHLPLSEGTAAAAKYLLEIRRPRQGFTKAARR